MFKLVTMKRFRSTQTPYKNADGKIIVYKTMEALRRDYPEFGKIRWLFAEPISKVSKKHIVIE